MPRHKIPDGPFYRGEGFTFISDEIRDLQFTHCLSVPERWFLLQLNRIVGMRKSLVIHAASNYLATETGIPERSVDRYLSPQGRLKKLRFIRVDIADQKNGNHLFVEPVFIWSNKWHLLDDFNRSALANLSNEHRQSGGTAIENDADSRTKHRQLGGAVDNYSAGTAKVAPKYRQTDGAKKRFASQEYRQLGGDLRSDLFSRNASPSRGFAKSKKRRALSAKEIQAKQQKMLAALQKEIAEEKLGKTGEGSQVGMVGKCNSRAEA